MAHPCKQMFWGDEANNLIEWCTFLDGVGPGSGRTLTEPTWRALTLVKSEIERATLCQPSNLPPWLGGGTFGEATETHLREIAELFVSLLAADEWDGVAPNPHAAPGAPGWIRTGMGNPDAPSLTVLVGGVFPPWTPATPGSLIGRIRSVLGS
jgi:hypothetical protein